MRQRLVKQPSGEYAWVSSRKERGNPQLAIEKPIEDSAVGALGCIESQVESMRASAKLLGHGTIEYRPDPKVKGFYNCYAPNQRAYDKWATACGQNVKNGQFQGKTITPHELEAAEKLVRERYGKKDSSA